nr:four-carbon acid sugar kinase family protein [Halomonas malpeensis]
MIVADDLTGTADSAVGCTQAGLATAVVLGAQATECAEAVALDLDSRGVSAAEAAERHRQALAAWQGRFRCLFKKVDSTLRGNVAAEIASLVPLAGMAIVAPAYPATGRTTRGGRQYLDGVPVEQTEVWTNEGIQGRANLVEMLEGAELACARLDLAMLRNDADLTATLAGHRDRGIQALVCDAEDEADLARLAARSAALSGVFWVGSAGLGNHLPKALGLIGQGERLRSLIGTPHTLIVIGSMSGVSHRQADRLLESPQAPTLIEIDASALRASGDLREIEACLDDALARRQNVMVRLRQGTDRNAAEGPLLGQALAALLAPRLGRVERLIATGGATARAILVEAGIARLALVDAPDTGMARLLAATPAGPLEVITKAGGFGDEHAFQRVWQGQPDPSDSSIHKECS